MKDHSNLAVGRAMLAAIEAGDIEALVACYHPAAEQIEWPNRLKPGGDRRGLDRLRSDFERGRTILSRQGYEVLGAVSERDKVALQVRWTGVLAIPLGSLPAGATMTAQSAIFLTFREGRIVEQQNFDCFEPF